MDIKKILFLYFLFLYYCNCQEIKGSLQLIKDSYSYNGNCMVQHLVYINSSIFLRDIYFIKNTQLQQNITTKIDYLSNYKEGANYYYSFNLYSNFDSTNYGILIYTDVLLQVGQVTLDTPLSIVCELPPSQLSNSVINYSFIPDMPIKIQNSFSVKIDNLKKPIQNLTIIQQTVSPFSLAFDNSQTNLINFKLSFNKLPSTNQLKMIYLCSYGTEGSFTLIIDSPITINPSDIDKITLSKYPSVAQYSTRNNWDLNQIYLFTIKNFDSKLFFFHQIPIYTSSYDLNQYNKLISGNYTNGVLLSSASFYPSNRATSSTSSPIYTRLYTNATLFDMGNITKDNPVLLKTTPSSISMNKYDVVGLDSNLFEYSFILNSLPINYSFIVKIGYQDSYRPIFPYGIESSNNSMTIFKFPYTAKSYLENSPFKYISNLKNTQVLTNSISNTDTNPPILNSFTIYYPRGGNGLYAFLRIEVTDDISGFDYLYFDGNYITNSDLVYGTSKNGTYEKRIIVNFNNTCYYADQQGNKVYCYNIYNPLSNYYYRLSPPLLVPRLIKNYTLEITYFKFDSPVYDVSDEGRLVTLFFNYSNSEYDIPIQFYLLDRVSGDKGINLNDITENRYWLDKSLNLFKIQILIHGKLCTGTLPYLLVINGQNYTNDYFYSMLGNDSNINIVSNNCNELPPLVSLINYFASTSYTNTLSISSPISTFGWSLTINTYGSTLKEVHIYGIGNSNRKQFGQSLFYESSSNTYSLNFDLTFSVDPLKDVSQTYQLYNITLIDQRGIKSEFIYDQDLEYLYENGIPKYPPPISPLLSLADNSLIYIYVSTPFVSDISPPTLFYITGSASTLDVSLLSNQIDFAFRTQDDTGLDTNFTPIVYLDSFNNFGGPETSRVECKNINTYYTVGNKSIDYSASCAVPYGFGYPNGISVSVFGIVDTSSLISGYTPKKIKGLTMASTYFISTSLNYKPLIESWAPIKENSTKLTIYGRNLNINSSTTRVVIENDFLAENISSFEYLSNIGIIANIPKNNKEFTLYIITNGLSSNSVTVNYYSSDSSESSDSSKSSESSDNPTIPPTIAPIVKCLGNPECGGPLRGNCIQNIGCRCISPYSGLDCMSETITIPKPYVNETTPDSKNEFPVSSNNIKLNTIISIIGIREMDIRGKEINKHLFTEWSFKELSTQLATSSHIYNSTIFKNNIKVSNIEIQMDWFEQSTPISFANQNFTINPSSLKYYINIDQYPFDNKLNLMELIIKSTFQSNENDVCSSKSFSLNDNTDYISLKIGKYTFEGKFIKNGIVDGLIRRIDNKLIDFNGTDTASTNKQYSYIAIQIPNYHSNVTLDPNFSVLIDPNAASSQSNDSICNKKSSKLTPAQIVGIIIGAIVFLTIALLIILFKFRNTSKFLSVKIFFYRSFKTRK